MNINSNIVMRTKQVCDLLNCSPSTVNRLVKAGKLPKIRISERAVGFRYQDVLNYVDSCTEVGSVK